MKGGIACMWMTHGYRYWGFPGLDLFGIVLFVFFVMVCIWMIKSVIEPHDDSTEMDEPTGREETALELLKKRYAKGELTKRQFMEMKKDILE